jgi:flagellar biosynthesis/type III secretory pathway M-ring protein FliF/YscJ
VAYIAGLVIAGLFFLTIKYFLQLSAKQEIIITLIVAVLIFAAVAFNSYSSAQREKMLNVVTKYKQNKTVVCQGKDVNSTNYDLSIGTYTFIGRENTPNYGEMISATSCE